MKFIIKTLVFCFVVVAIIYSLAIFPIWDDSQVTDTDLLLTQNDSVNEEENIYTALPYVATASEEEQLAVTELKSWYVGSAESNFVASSSIATTTGLINQFEVALTRPAFFCPETAISKFNVRMSGCSLHNMRDLAVLVAAHSQFHVLSGDAPRALQLNTALLRFGNQVLTQKYPLMVDYVVGLEIMKIGFDSLDKLALPQPEAEALRRQFFPTSDSLVFAMQYKYMYLKSVFESEVGTGINTYTMQSNRSLNHLADLTRINIATVPCDNMSERTILSQKADQLEPADQYTLLRPNALGNMYVASLFSPEDKVSELYCALEMRVGSTRGL